MQEAILNFGHTAAGTDAFKMAPQGTGAQQAPSGEYLGGHDAFSSFLFNNYLDVSKNKPGQGFVSTENLGQKTRMDTAKNRPDVGNLRNWVETIMHVGSPSKGGEYKPDGVWGLRTNNGLKAIADFSEMMFSFAKDMEIPLDEFSVKGIEEFRGKIPSVNDSGKLEGNNSTLAKIMTSYVKALTGIVSGFKTKIMESPSWKNYLSQDKPLLTGEGVPLDKQENTIIQLHGQTPLNLGIDDDEARGALAGYTKLSLNDLSNKEKFVNFLKSNNIPSESPQDIQSAINLIRQRLQKNEVLQRTR
jgi:hypothetical protein